MVKHDLNMPHDMRYVLGNSLDDRGCPPNCPVAKAGLDSVFATVLKEESSVTKRKIYISGPMRGYENLNHPAFDAVERTLSSDWDVLSPAAKDREEGWDNSTSYATCIRADIQFLLAADAIVLLPGWESSEGARFEAEIARSLGLEFYTAHQVECTWYYSQVQSPSEIKVEGIDQEARRLVYGERAATYGHPRGDFDTIGMLWAGILQSRAEAIDRKNAGFFTRLRDRLLGRNAWAELLSAETVAILMAALKLARLASSPDHHDSQVDTIGYMLCLARVQEDPAETAAWERRPSSDSVPTFEGHDPV